MIKILAIGGSNSKKSINTAFATYIASQVADAEVTVLNWEGITLPLFGVDLQDEIGIPEAAQDFLNQIKEADGIVLSVAEHNGNITAAFKNLWDWASRLEQKVWMNKPMFLASTSPGGRGAKSAIETIEKIMPHYGGNVVARMSLPLFNENLKAGKIQDDELQNIFHTQLELFAAALNSTKNS